MKQYHKLLDHVLTNGTSKDDRTETGIISVFGYQNRYDLSKGFPIVNTKPTSFKNIIVELLWFLRGDSNIKYLVENGCNIWTEDSYNYYIKLCKNQGLLDRLSFEQFKECLEGAMCRGTAIPKYYKLGDTGEQYPKLWRRWKYFQKFTLTDAGYNDGEVDQIHDLIQGLINNPTSRRHMITALNPSTYDQMALFPCHCTVQFNCRPTDLTFKTEWYDNNPKASESECPMYYLDCQLYQRSADAILGVPYNIASYSLLTHILCEICNMIPGDFIHSFGDLHIYNNHIEAAKEQLQRDPEKYELPTLEMPTLISSTSFDKKELDSLINILEPSDFRLDNYQHYPKLENSTPLNTGLK